MVVDKILTCQMPRIKRGANNVCQCSNFSISSLIIGNNRCGSFSTLQSIYARRDQIKNEKKIPGLTLSLT